MEYICDAGASPGELLTAYIELLIIFYQQKIFHFKMLVLSKYFKAVAEKQ